MYYQKIYEVVVNIHGVEQTYAFSTREEVLFFITDMKGIFKTDIACLDIKERIIKIDDLIA